MDSCFALAVEGTCATGRVHNPFSHSCHDHVRYKENGLACCRPNAGKEVKRRKVMRTSQQSHSEERGPAIWLAGDPADLTEWMDRGAYGIVTNTVVQNQLVQKYGTLKDLIQRYLDMTEKPVVVEIDGQSTEELLEVGHAFTTMSKQIIIKIPCTSFGLGAFSAFAKEGVETFCTTVFSLPQAAAVAQAGATHVLPFCEPVKQLNDDPARLVRECRQMFDGWAQKPYVTAALVRSVDVAYSTLLAGADGIIIFWTTFKEMMDHPLTDQWNKTFLNEWEKMYVDGKLDGIPVVH